MSYFYQENVKKFFFEKMAQSASFLMTGKSIMMKFIEICKNLKK
jgi:hypothetical protein